METRLKADKWRYSLYFRPLLHLPDCNLGAGGISCILFCVCTYLPNNITQPVLQSIPVEVVNQSLDKYFKTACEKISGTQRSPRLLHVVVGHHLSKVDTSLKWTPLKDRQHFKISTSLRWAPLKDGPLRQTPLFYDRHLSSMTDTSLRRT